MMGIEVKSNLTSAKVKEKIYGKVGGRMGSNTIFKQWITNDAKSKDGKYYGTFQELGLKRYPNWVTRSSRKTGVDKSKKEKPALAIPALRILATATNKPSDLTKKELPRLVKIEINKMNKNKAPIDEGRKALIRALHKFKLLVMGVNSAEQLARNLKISSRGKTKGTYYRPKSKGIMASKWRVKSQSIGSEINKMGV